MSNLTVNSIYKSIRGDILNEIPHKTISIESSFDKDDIINELVSVLDNVDFIYNVAYTHEAWDIVGGGEFNNYEADYLDFSNCDSSLDCIMHEADGITAAVSYECFNEIIEEIAERFEEICNTAFNLGFDDMMTLSSGDSFGWNAHKYETEEGTCVHGDLEGEKGLMAVVGGYNGLYLSACFNKEV